MKGITKSVTMDILEVTSCSSGRVRINVKDHRRLLKPYTASINIVVSVCIVCLCRAAIPLLTTFAFVGAHSLRSRSSPLAPRCRCDLAARHAPATQAAAHRHVSRPEHASQNNGPRADNYLFR
ncbi:unnamed protein product [Arctia plantaginis]|uniref:Uncharacterized protein n=1 Tax=Arctia plantaginis TaxID=874455 RepID=A0A8S1ABG6_ARCPL|nr:unnamed protein product [Arctia plantaginis]